MKRNNDYSEMISKYGTDDVSGGKLTGTTDTDYFYFLCPKCNGGGTEIMRILNFGTVDDLEFKHTDLKKQPEKLFHFSFELYCEKCETHTVTKLTNCTGWQGGSITHEAIGLQHKVFGANEELPK